MKKKNHFPGLVLAYAMLWIAVTAVGLRYLWGRMAAYEDSRPSYAIETYVGSFDDGHLHRVCDEFIGALDHRLQSEEEAFAVIRAEVDKPLSYAKMSKLSTEEKLVYAISTPERTLGSVTLVKDGQDWKIAREEMDFSWLLSSAAITVPSDWQVSCNGRLLDSSFHTQEGIPYEELDFLREDGYPTPDKTAYLIPRYLGQPVFTVTDRRGEEQLSDGGELGEDPSQRISGEDRARVEKLVDDFLPRYIQFVSCANRKPTKNYEELRPYMIPGSRIDTRIYNAIAGLAYAHSYGDALRDVEIHAVYDLGKGYYMADISYKIDTTNDYGIYTSEAAIKLIMKDTADGLLVENLYTY